MLADVVLIKQQLRSLAAVVAPLLHISFTNIGRLATWPGSGYLEKPISWRNRLVFMITVAFQRFPQPLSDESFMVRSPVMMPGDFSMFSYWFLLSIGTISPGCDELQARSRIKLKLLWKNCRGSLKLPCYSLLVASYYRANERRGINAVLLLRVAKLELTKLARTYGSNLISTELINSSRMTCGTLTHIEADVAGALIAGSMKRAIPSILGKSIHHHQFIK